MSLTILAPIGRNVLIEFHVDSSGLLQRKSRGLNRSLRTYSPNLLSGKKLRLVFVMRKKLTEILQILLVILCYTVTVPLMHTLTIDLGA